MWKKPGKPVPIHYSQLVLGLYVSLKENWSNHPFLYNDFLLNTQKKIDTIQALKLDKLFYYPDRSTVEPAPLGPEFMANASSGKRESDAIAAAEKHQLAKLQQERKEKIAKQKDAAARADRNWERAAKATREALLDLPRSPKQAGKKLLELSGENASTIAGSQEILLHLLGDKNGDGPQFHAINVMTLSMLLGKLCGMTEAQLADLALGALAHDAGKARVPAYLLKLDKRAKHEEAFYRQHTAYGVELASESGVFNEAAIEIISDHHEAMDGSGWPNGKSEFGLATRIVALVNRYDRLCNPESPEREALMPTTALAVLFKNESKKFDSVLLGMLIKVMGIYPPGTIVHLNDGAIGMVVCPGKESLRPKVLVYNPDLLMGEAPTIDLSEEPDLKIDEALRPASLPPEVLAWLNPRKRLSYFYAVEGQAQ
jgi:HD-GYP domain-containing protein (c-di-GMP phosphodiesterase class II)